MVLYVNGTPDWGTYDEFIVKIYGGCNFKCPDCYVFEKKDTSYLELPMVMSIATAKRVAERISDHVLELMLPEVRMVLHGGEPLMAGMTLIGVLVGETRRLIEKKTGGRSRLLVAIQTNGWLLNNQRVLDQLHELGVLVGVSFDGDEQTHNSVRRTLPTLTHLEGLPTFEGVCRGIERMRRSYSDMFSGVLCVINVASDPISVHNALVALKPPSIDYIWPLATWDSPPPNPNGEATAYAKWLIRLWRHHLSLASDEQLPRIRYFDMLMRQLHTGWNPMELLGLPARGALVIDTAGNYCGSDALSIVGNGMMGLEWSDTNLDYKEARLRPGTRMTVHNCPIHDAAIQNMEMNRLWRVRGLNDDGPVLCPTCTACPVRMDCGGGFWVHRWKTGSGFWNPSVYCEDLKVLLAYAEELYRQVRAYGKQHDQARWAR